jgi:hypothetical protein
MNTKSLTEDIKTSGGLKDLFKPTIYYRYDFSEDYLANLSTYEVDESDEMRIDLIFQKMYELDPSSVIYDYKHIDVILAINNIQNPMNIKKGMILKYPNLGDLDNYRITNQEINKSQSKSVVGKLGVVNKSTRTDKTRKAYQDNGYQLPPTVRKAPKIPVTIEGGNYKLGGLQT